MVVSNLKLLKSDPQSFGEKPEIIAFLLKSKKFL